MTPLGGAIRLRIVWLLPNKRNAWDCLEREHSTGRRQCLVPAVSFAISFLFRAPTPEMT